MSKNKEHLRYIRQSKKDGYSDTDIRRALEEIGWSRAEVERAFDEVSRHFLHMHMFHRHVPFWIAGLILIFVAGAIFTTTSAYFNNGIGNTNIFSKNLGIL